MKQIWQDKLAHDLAREWLEKHEPQKERPKRRPRRELKLKRGDGGTAERWQIKREQRFQERRMLARPLLKGVE